MSFENPAELRTRWVVGFGNTGPNAIELHRSHWLFAVLDGALKTGFHHCFAYSEGHGFTQFFEVGADRIAHYSVPEAQIKHLGFESFTDYLTSTWNGTLVRWDAALPRHYIPRYAPLTCVSFTKLLIGARSNALTPHQLYKYLVRNGGEVL